MKIAGIVAEFNPFHAGHAVLIQSARRQGGATHVVAVMSGNFVQRGEAAVTDKRVRARCALENGVDLVLELPLAYATATAHHFAKGAVTTLEQSGCVDMLAFGSESGDPALLRRLAAAVDDPRMQGYLRPHLEQGLTFARARQLAAARLVGAEAEALGAPNNALAVEYLRAAGVLGWQPQVHTMPRQGAAHDGQFPRGSFASASYLRGVAADFEELARYMPENCAVLLKQAGAQGLYPADLAKLETAVLARLRLLEPADFARLPGISEGLENKLYHGVRAATSLEGLCGAVKSKRYTLARVRRLVLHAFLGVTETDVAAPPPYLRVLGFNGAGRQVLARMSQTASLPVSAKLGRLEKAGVAAARAAQLEVRSTDLYTLCLPRPRPCGYEMTASGVFLKEGL